jgi:hypothetical protein
VNWGDLDEMSKAVKTEVDASSGSNIRVVVKVSHRPIDPPPNAHGSRAPG